MNNDSLSLAIKLEDLSLIEKIAPEIEKSVKNYSPETDIHLAISTDNLQIVKIIHESLSYFKNNYVYKIYEKCLEWACVRATFEVISYFVELIEKTKPGHLKSLSDYFINLVANRGLYEETKYLRLSIGKRVSVLNNYQNKKLVDFVLNDGFIVNYHCLLKMISSNRVDLFLKYYYSLKNYCKSEELFTTALSTENYKTVYEVLRTVNYEFNYNYLYVLFSRFNEMEMLNIVKLNLYKNYQKIFDLSIYESKVMISYYIISNFNIVLNETLFELLIQRKMALNNKIWQICERDIKIEKMFEILCFNYEFKLADRYRNDISFWKIFLLKCKVRHNGNILILNYLKEK